MRGGSHPGVEAGEQRNSNQLKLLDKCASAKYGYVVVVLRQPMTACANSVVHCGLVSETSINEELFKCILWGEQSPGMNETGFYGATVVQCKQAGASWTRMSERQIENNQRCSLRGVAHRCCGRRPRHGSLSELLALAVQIGATSCPACFSN